MFWKQRKPAQPKPTLPANLTPAVLATIDSQTLLELERDSRKRHKRNLAKAIGTSSKLLYKAPIAIVSIAKTGLATKQTFLEHDDIMKEVSRRGLAPLEQQPDENIYVMVAGQLIAVAVGHKMGEKVAAGIVEPLVTHFGGIAVEHMTQKFTEAIVEEAAEDIMMMGTSKATMNIPAGESSGITGQDEPQRFQQQLQPPQHQQKPPSIASNAAKIASTVVATSISLASNFLKKTPGANLESPQAQPPLQSQQQRQVQEPPASFNFLKTTHFNGTWSGFAEELELSILDPSTDDDIAAEIKSITESLHSSPETDDAGRIKTVEVLARYRMKYEFEFNAHMMRGRNIVDGIDGVWGGIDAYNQIHFEEIAKGNGDTGDVKVQYAGKIGGGLLIGEWVSSDGRQGLFKLKHV